MRRLAGKLLIAAPVGLILLLLPFGIAYLLRHTVTIPRVASLGLGLGMCYAAFFKIAGADMRRVDQEYKHRIRPRQQ